MKLRITVTRTGQPLTLADSLWMAPKALVRPQETSKCSTFHKSGCLIKQLKPPRHKMRQWCRTRLPQRKTKQWWRRCWIAHYLKIHLQARITRRAHQCPACTEPSRVSNTFNDIKKTFKSTMPVFPPTIIWSSAGYITWMLVYQDSTWMTWLQLRRVLLALVVTQFSGKICLKSLKQLTWMRSLKSGRLVTTWPYQTTP